jgi:hypothetical protein
MMTKEDKYMNSRYAGLALIVASLVAGCSTRPQQLLPGAELVQVGKGDVANYQYLGEVSGVHGAGCGVFGYRGSYAGAVADLRNKAKAMGANYVQIMSQTQPFPAHNCFVNEYIIDATAYRNPAAPVPIAHAQSVPVAPITHTSPISLPYAPSIANPVSVDTKEQQVNELMQQKDLSYEEYQRRYRAITGE